VLPAVVALGFFLTWLPLQLWIHSFPRLSTAAYTTGIGAGNSWIDAAVGRNADVTIVWSGDNPYRGWENEFWNRSVKHAYDLTPPDTLIAGSTEPPLTVQGSTGILLDPAGKPVRVRYVLADASARILGRRIAADDGRSMVLYRVDGILRTGTWVSGWFSDTWTKPNVTWVRRDCVRGVLRIPVHSDPTLYRGVVQRIAISGTTRSRVVLLPSTATKTIAVPVQPRGGTCRVRFSITPSRRPVDYPSLNNRDARTLGVLASGFQYEPAPGA
jgi:hypothetical protein